MKLALRDVEPSNIPPVDNHSAAMFMRHLTGGETFEWSGSGTPRALIIYDLRYAYPRISSATGWLISIDQDAFERAASRPAQNAAELLKRYVVGRLTIEFGGTHPQTTIHAVPL